VTRWARRRPGHLAWADESRRCSWSEAADRVRRLTGWLEARGIGPGDRVALWLGNRGALLEALFASARLGAIVLPVNARLTPIEVAFQLDDSTPKLLLVERAWEFRARAALAIAKGPPPAMLCVGEAFGDAGGVEGGLGADGSRGAGDRSMRSGADATDRDVGRDVSRDAYEDALSASPPSDRCEPVSPDAPMILMYTSGTTGKPKGALLPHRKAFYNSLNAQLCFDLRAADRMLVAAPLFHSLGLQILALPALYAGAAVVLEDLQGGFDARRVWSTILRQEITCLGGVPTMHERLLQALQAGDPVSRVPHHLRFAFTAGAAAPPGLIRAFHEHGLLMKQGYGQTETSLLTCLEPEDALAKAGSVGRPVFHADLRLVDPVTIEGPVDGWRDVEPGEIGEIVVRGPITMLGYWRRPEETADTLRGEWLRTGDLATQDGDSDVTLVGRAREMYISGGENVYPAEVEATLIEHEAIAEVAVIGIPDPEWGAVGRAHVVLREGADCSAADLGDWLDERLARFKQPREIVFEAALPRTASGKIQKHRLRPRGVDREPGCVGPPPRRQ